MAIERNVSAFDAWTFVHIGLSVGAALIGMPRPAFYLLNIGTEAVERRLIEMGLIQRESGLNVFGDLLVGALAYELTRSFIRRRG